MRYLRRAWLCLSLGLFMAMAMVPAAAAERVALLIGNDEYRDESSRLLNAARDARDLGAALRRLGFQVILRQNADLDAMRSAVREFGSTLDRATVALFFYAGHAIQVNGNNYLIPTNLAPKSEREVMFDGLELSPIIWMMGERTKKIVILDACRDNPFKELRASAGLAQAVAPPDTLIAYATAPNAVAYDGSGSNGVFTKSLLRHIATPGDSIFKVFSKVSESVHRDTRTQKVPQVPWILSSLRGDDFSFATGPAMATTPAPAAAGSMTSLERSTLPSVDVAMNVERAFWESIDKGRRDELAEYLERYPKGLFASLAQRRLAALDAKPAAAAEVAASAAVAGDAAGGRPGAAALGPAGPTTLRDSPPRPAPAQAPAAAPAPPPLLANAAPTTRAVAPPSAAAAASRHATTRSDVRFPDGATYSGEIRGGVAHGQGDIREPNGYRYVGQFHEGRAHGRGTARWPDGRSFDGQFRDGLPNGPGVLRTSNGDVFDGEFRAGVIHGTGRMKFAGGDSYEGQIVDGRPSGRGRFQFASGDVYEGDFIAGALSGKGTLRGRSGDVVTGEFRAGRANGMAKLTMRSGDVYEGEFRDHVFAGQGRYLFASGMRYEGQFADGEINGRGLLTYEDGRRFEGDFRRGLREARGSLTDRDGRTVPAEIVGGMMRSTN